MAEVLIRGLSRKTVDRLKARAKARGRSLQAELKQVLEQAGGAGRVVPAEVERVRALFKGRHFTDSAKLIREDRDR